MSDAVILQVGTPRLTRNAGLNRVVWDLAHSGPWDNSTRSRWRNGPRVAPSVYTLRLTADGISETQRLTVRADPRVVRDDVTTETLRAQLAHSLRVRDLVNDVSVTVSKLDSLKRRLAASGQTGSDSYRRLLALEQKLVTPSVRYSKPALQSHIQYLYGATASADQKVGRDASLRYLELRKELDSAKAELRAIEVLGPR
jgi:hypothetical protein